MASFSPQTHYEILGITQQAQLQDIKDAFRKLALKHHPDKDPRNPQANAAFQRLGAAYETLSDNISRARYDVTLASYQRAGPRRPADWQNQTSSNANAWQEDMRRRAWEWCRNAQDAADQARREDAAYWSGPSYAHGAFDSGEWRKQQDREQKEKQDLHEHQQQQRAARRAARKEARKEARNEAERNKRDASIPPPPPPTSDQDREELKARPEREERDEETEEKARRPRHKDNGGRRKPPSPQRPDRDWSDRTEEEYQQRLQKVKQERAARRKAESEQFEETWRAELQFLLSSIINIEVDIDKIAAKVNGSKMSMEQDEREDEDCEVIFEASIKRQSLKRRLKDCLDEYKRIVKLLGERGREQEANEVNIKLREARKRVANDQGAGHKRNSQGEQTKSTTPTSRTKTKTKATRETNQGKLPADDERSDLDRKTHTPQRSPLPQTSYEYETDSKVNYDGSDPDRGFTEDTPEPSLIGDDYDYDDEEYDPPFCNDFHDSHMEVHREFWDIIDSWHECSFCHAECTVMRCPRCDVQACASCKDAYG